MKKESNEMFDNPVSQRFVKMYNNMTKEQQTLFDAIDDLPKEQKYLKRIQRKRKPQIDVGTIFAMHLPEDIYLYGKILAKADNLPMIEDDYFVAMINKKATGKIKEMRFEMKEADILTGPWIVSDALWKNGTFYTVGSDIISENEQKLAIGFYKSKYQVQADGSLKNSGYYLDIYGNTIDYEPAYLEHCAYITIDGIEHDIRTHMLLGNIITEN